MRDDGKGEKAAVQREALLSQGIFLAVVFGFFLSAGRYVLVFQESQSLFIWSGGYFRQFLAEPGGLLEYAGEFLTQFYAGEVSGPLILAVVLTLPATVLHLITRRLFPAGPNSWVFPLLPSCLLFILQVNLYHEMEYNLGFLLVLLFYLFSLSSPGKLRRALAMGLIPLLYFLAGAYAIVFGSLLVVHTLLLQRGGHRYAHASLVLTVIFLSFLFVWRVLFVQSVRHTLLSPFPTFENSAHGGVLVLLTGCIVFVPFLSGELLRVLRERLGTPVYSIPSRAIVLAVLTWLLVLQYDSEIRTVVELEELAHAGRWEEAIELQESARSRFGVGQYLYSIALSETDQLCDRLFSGPQDFGPGSLFLPWAIENLGNGALFYYAVGLANEAQRWAYEDMVVYGYRPRNLKILAKTSLINGDYGVARKYLHLLSGSLFYRAWAREFEELASHPDLIRSHPELAAKLDILPRTNFFVEYQDPQSNLLLLLDGQPENGKALEFLLAGRLLTRDLEFAVNSIRGLREAGYSRIPRHLEEAALIYSSLTGALPDLGGLTISTETQARFERFSASYAAARSHPSSMREQMRSEFCDTFWFYFFFP